MSACCTEIENLGCVNFCDTIETGAAAPATGTYVIEDTTNGFHFEVSGVIGQQITFTNRFNEDSITVFKIKRNGDYVSFGNNDCFQVKVRSSIDLT